MSNPEGVPKREFQIDEPVIPVTEDHPAIYRDGHHLTATPVGGQLKPIGIDSIRKYQEMAMRTLAQKVAENDPTIFADPRAAMHWNAASGMASEAGEINELYKKYYFHFHPWNESFEEHLKKEHGDLMWYLMLGCYANGWDPAEILAMNIEKLRARYPDGFSPERSMNRKAGDV